MEYIQITSSVTSCTHTFKTTDFHGLMLEIRFIIPIHPSNAHYKGATTSVVKLIFVNKMKLFIEIETLSFLELLFKASLKCKLNKIKQQYSG